MEWLPPLPETPAFRSPVERISFDLIRAAIAARQSASLTSRSLKTALQAERHDATHTPSAMQLLAGQSAHPGDGAFAQLFPPVVHGAPVSDGGPVPDRDRPDGKSHA